MPEAPKQEIARLHGEIEDGLRTTIDKAIRIGELLTKEKKRVGHGNWEAYVDALPFSIATAKNYRMVYRFREKAKTLSVSGLTDLYRQLRKQREAPKKKPEQSEPRQRDNRTKGSKSNRVELDFTPSEARVYQHACALLQARWAIVLPKDVVLESLKRSLKEGQR